MRKEGSSTASRCRAVIILSWSAVLFGSTALCITGAGKCVLARLRQLPLYRGDVQRAGEVVHHRVQDLLHALVLEGAAAENRKALHPDGPLADGPREQVLGDVALLHVGV